jgi:hypothetical protein
MEQSAQLAPKGPIGHRPQGGVNAAVRELGIDRTEAQRAVKIDSLAPEAKIEAKALHLDHNKRALLGAAKVPSKEAQIRALREEAARKAGSSGASASEARIQAAVNAVKRLSQKDLRAFADWFTVFRAKRGERTSADGAPGWTGTMRI